MIVCVTEALQEHLVVLASAVQWVRSRQRVDQRHVHTDLLGHTGQQTRSLRQISALRVQKTSLLKMVCACVTEGSFAETTAATNVQQGRIVPTKA